MNFMVRSLDAKPKRVLDVVLENYDKPKFFRHNCYAAPVGENGAHFFYMKLHKCASTSIIASLAAQLSLETGQALPPGFPTDVHKYKGENLPFIRVNQTRIPKLIRFFNQETTFTFTVARDPIRRVVSAWADKVTGPGRISRNIKILLDLPPRKPIPLSEFLRLLEEEPGIIDLDHHWRPQSKEGSFNALNYDFVGDTSQLGRSMSYAFKQIFGTTKVPMVDTRSLIGHRTDSKELANSLSADDLKRIKRIYAEDYEIYENAKANLAKVNLD